MRTCCLSLFLSVAALRLLQGVDPPKAVDKLVAQSSKPAVSQVSKPATRPNSRTLPDFPRSADLEIGDTAGLETCATLRLSDFVHSPTDPPTHRVVPTGDLHPANTHTENDSIYE